MIRAALVLALLSGSAAAQGMPALHDVIGVASDDVLNVRSGPDAGSARIGALAPGATGIEVVELSGTGWGRVNVDEGSGWVSLRYLARHPDQPPVPERLTCFGTEPFWSLVREGNAARYATPDDPEVLLAVAWSTESSVPGRFALGLQGPDQSLRAVIRRELCSDGMSDRVYGMSVDLVIDGGTDGPALLAGCCTLAR